MPSFREFWDSYAQQLRPRFYETSAYLIAFTCCWLFIFHPDFRDGVLFFFSGFGSMSPYFIGFGLILAVGLVLSLIHAFIKRAKSPLEKGFMGWFLTATSAGAGFFSGFEMLDSRSWISQVLAVWNILTSIVLWAQMGMQKYEVSDEDASPMGIFVTTAILVVFLWLSDTYLHLSWALTLSISIFYATSILFAVSWLLGRLDFQVADVLKPTGSKRD